MNDQIYLELGGKRFINWKSFTVSRNINNFCGSFNATLKITTEEYAQLIYDELSTDKPAKIFIGEDQIFEGWAFSRSRGITSEETNVSISGRDLTADLVDCTLELPNYELNNVTIKSVCDMICSKFGVYSSVTLNEKQVFQRVAIDETESGFSVIDRMCKSRSLIPTTNRFGDLVIRDLSVETVVESIDSLVYGDNILEISETVELSERYSSIKIIGKAIEKSEDEDKNISEILSWGKRKSKKKNSEKIKDPNFKIADNEIKRYRHISISNENIHRSDSLRKKALWERRTRRGKTFGYTIKVRGFHQRGIATRNPLWDIFNKVYLRVQPWKIDGVYIIDGIKYSYDDSGKFTELHVVPVDTYATEVPDDVPDSSFLKPKEKKSNDILKILKETKPVKRPTENENEDEE
jgi:prophage tail gpP-like protein